MLTGAAPACRAATVHLLANVCRWASPLHGALSVGGDRTSLPLTGRKGRCLDGEDACEEHDGKVGWSRCAEGLPKDLEDGAGTRLRGFMSSSVIL